MSDAGKRSARSEKDAFPEGMKSVYLCSDKKDKWSHRFLECLWGKTEAIKNDPRMNYILLRAARLVFLLAIFAVLLALLMKFIFLYVSWSLSPTYFFWSDIFEKTGKVFSEIGSFTLSGIISLAFTALGAISLAYWNMAKVNREQWQYCAGLYNDYLKALSKSEKNPEVLVSALAIDLLTLDLWAQRSFRDLFALEMIAAIEDKHRTNPENIETALEKLRSKEMCESEAMCLLEAYQVSILKKHDKPEQGFESVFSAIKRRITI